MSDSITHCRPTCRRRQRTHGTRLLDGHNRRQRRWPAAGFACESGGHVREHHPDREEDDQDPTQPIEGGGGGPGDVALLRLLLVDHGCPAKCDQPHRCH